MENNASRILIEVTVRQTLKGLKADTRRGVRNLVDMALQFSEGRFQSRFFETARTLLENPDSGYYRLVDDAANHIDTEHLVNFGMDLGYNSCTWGARRIRANEAKLGFNIPWTVFLRLGEELTARLEQYDAAIAEGEGLGIYCWMLHRPEAPLDALPLVERHPDSAFFLYCASGAVTPELAEEARRLRNLMLVVRLDEGAAAACGRLREALVPYSVYFSYSAKDCAAIEGGEVFRAAQRLHPVFTALAPRPDCAPETVRSAYRAAVDARKSQSYQTVPWELCCDTRSLDEIISDDACLVCFDEEGSLFSPEGGGGGNLFQDGFTPVIRRAYPKAAR